MAKLLSRNSTKRNGHAPKEKANVSELGLELERLRARYLAGGGKLLNRRELEREIAARRGLG